MTIASPSLKSTNETKSTDFENSGMSNELKDFLFKNNKNKVFCIVFNIRLNLMIENNNYLI